MFEKYFGSGYEVEKLFIHNCSLKHISSQTFRQFVGRIVKAREYHLELMKGALPNHVNDDLVKMPSLLRYIILIILREISSLERMLYLFLGLPLVVLGSTDSLVNIPALSISI